LFSAGASGHAQTFVQPHKITGVYAPYTLTFGDVNGDGRTDIVMGSTAGYTQVIQIYLAQPGGGYKNSATLPFYYYSGAGTPVPGCLLADINSDHNLDLVCAGVDQLLATYLGNGDGTFQARVDAGGTSGWGPVVDGPFDLNGDGIPDFIVDGALTGVSTYAVLGDGRGNFNVSFYFPVNSPYLVQTVADINGDGKPDLLASTGPSVAPGLGGGKFGSFQSYGTYSSCFYADIDQDGHLDAVCSNMQFGSAASTVVVLHGNSDGSFNTTPLLTQSYAGQSLGQLIGVADINGDGISDLIFGWNELGAVSVSLGLPNHAGFSVATTWVNGAPGCFDSSPTRFLFPDLNGDGLADVVGCTTNEIDISYGQSSGALATAPEYQAVSSSVAMTLADLNGDGAPDAVSVNSTTGAIDVAFAKGDGTFLSAQSHAFTGYAAPTQLYDSVGTALIGDFNGDGIPDVLAALVPVAGTGGQVFQNIFWGEGNGTLAMGVVTPSSAPALLIPNVISASPASYVADVNGDGKDDIVQGLFLPGGGSPSAGPPLNVFLSNGDGTFREVQNNLPADPLGPGFSDVSPSNPAFADFNEDGKLDVAYGSLSNVYLVSGNGDGSFATAKATVLPIPALPQYSPYESVGTIAGDFDGDGHQDLAVAVLGQCSCFPTGTDAVFLILYFGDGHGGLSSGLIADKVLYQAGAVNYMLPMATADFRREGRPEIVFSPGSMGTPQVGEVDLVHITTQRTVDTQTIVTGDQTIFTGDFNRDGFPDLLLTIPGYTQVKVLLNLGGLQGNIASTATTLTQTATTITAGGSITFTATVSPSTAAGTVTFLDGSVTLGRGTLTAGIATYTTTALTTGPHSITASYGGDANDYGSTSLASRVTVNATAAIGTTTTLASTATTAATGTSITFTATVTSASGSTTPTGTITFLDGTTTLGTGTLSSGKATYTTSALAVGSHSITASYGGLTGAFSVSTSSPGIAVAITTAPTPDFTLSLSSTTATVTHGASATTIISVTPLNGFSTATSLICAGAPANSTCTIAPTSVTPSGTAASSATLTLQTSVQIGAFAAPATHDSRLASTALAVALPFGMLALLTARRRYPAYSRFLIALFLLAGLLSIAACGSSPSASTVQTSYPTAGIYPLTVTAASSSDTHTATFTVTIE
jgi:Bacterial Ig-like domain (group 3)/FG-GAP-like repeat/FG-GAP repeat